MKGIYVDLEKKSPRRKQTSEQRKGGITHRLKAAEYAARTAYAALAVASSP